MKKYFLPFAFCLLPFTLPAQELASAKGEPILPEKGNWGIMFDAVPFFKYAGNVFTDHQQSSSTSAFPKGFENTLVLKKINSETRLLRIKIRIGFSSNSIDSTVVFLGGPNPEPTVTDSRKVSKQNITIGVGTQKSIGKKRVHGYFGKELLFGFHSGDTTYTYGGGALTQFNWLHTNTFGQERGMTSIKEGSTFSINLHIVFGVEYFFAPKMSLSAEYSWGLGYRKTGEGKQTKEAWNFQSNKIKTTTEKIRGSSAIAVDNDNNAASLNLSFYF